MSSLPTPPAWLYEAPDPVEPELAGDGPSLTEYDPPDLSKLTEEELVDWLGPLYSGRDVASSATELMLDPLWWTLGNAAEFIEANMKRADVGSSPLFLGLNRIEVALRAGELQAYGSIDAAPIRAIPIEAWPEFVMVPSNIAPTGEETVSYDISIRSVRSYRAAALNDHSFPSGDVVPSASEPQGEPGYHRVISDAFAKESDVRRLVSIGVPKSKQRKVGKKQQRLAKTLDQLMIKGQKVYPDRGTMSFAEITRAVVKLWIKEDERLGLTVEYNSPSEEQAIRRFYLDQR